jgi:transposase-like protein
MSCPFCRSNEVEKRGRTVTKQGDMIVRFICSVCGNTFFIEWSKAKEFEGYREKE